MLKPLLEIKKDLVSFEGVRIIKGLPDYLALYPTYLEHKWQVTVEVTDDETKQLETYRYLGQKIILKNHISGIEASFSNSKKAFQVIVYAAEVDELPTWVFTSMEEAVELKNQIQEWLLRDPGSYYSPAPLQPR
jgi:hypothetical protein